MRLKLDSKAIAKLALPPDQDEQFYWDTDLSGFGLRMRKGGHWTFVAQYRNRGRTRRLVVGDAKKVDATQARKAARKILAEVELGGDPQGAKQEARRQAVHTLHSVAHNYLEAKAPALRPASYKVTKLYLTGAYFKPLHATAVTAITRADVAARVGAITRASGSVTAKQARAALSTLFKWAMGEGLTSDNPVIGTNVPAGPIARERVLTDLELVSVWRACDEDDFGRIVRLLILLGCRRAEAGGMRWSEIDVEAATWKLPGARTKNKRAMTLPLSPAALAIIKAVPQTNRDELFGMRAVSGFTEWDKAKQALDERLGDTVAPFRLHDLRRSVATKMADDLGVFPHIVETVLNHAGGHKAGTAGIYNRANYTSQVRNAMIQWSEHVMALVEGRKDKVVPLRA
jgi:integrase